MSNYQIDWENYFLPEYWFRLNEPSGTCQFSGKPFYSTVSRPGSYVNVTLNRLGVTGRCAYFNGSNANATFGNAQAYLFISGIQEFTIAFWVKGAAQADKCNISHHRWNSTGYFRIGTDPTTPFEKLSVTMQNDSSQEIFSGTDNDMKSTATVYDDNWHHVVVIISETAGYIYIDGEYDTTMAVSNPIIEAWKYLNHFVIGAYCTAAPTYSKYFAGYMQDVRLYYGKMQAEDINQLYKYTSNWKNTIYDLVDSMKPDDYTKLLLHFDNNLYDSSKSEHSVHPHDTVTVTNVQNKFGDYSCYFDGVGDYLRINDNLSDFEIESSPFTIDMWVYYTGSMVTNRNFVAKGDGVDIEWVLFLWSTDSKLHFTWWNGTTNSSVGADDIIDITNAWHHIAVVRDDTNTSLFVDGALVGQTANTATDIMEDSGGSRVTIGIHTALNSPYLGYIDELRISKGIDRTQDPNDYMYIGSGTDFTVPPSAYIHGRRTKVYTNQQSLVTRWPFHWWKLNETTGSIANDYGLDSIDGNITGTVMGQEGYRRNNCFRFNGADDVDVDVLTILNGSLSLWFKADGAITAEYAFGCGAVGNTYHGGLAVGNLTGSYSNESIGWATTAGLSMYVRNGHSFYRDGRWHHVVAVVDGVNNRIIMDGEVQTMNFDGGSSTTSNAFLPSTHVTDVGIGRRFWTGSFLYFNGYIQDVQIYNVGLTDVEAYNIYKYGLPTNALGTYCGKYYPELLEKDQIKTVNQNRWDGSILTEKSRTIDSDDAIIINPGDF